MRCRCWPLLGGSILRSISRRFGRLLLFSRGGGMLDLPIIRTTGLCTWRGGMMGTRMCIRGPLAIHPAGYPMQQTWRSTLTASFT